MKNWFKPGQPEAGKVPDPGPAADPVAELEAKVEELAGQMSALATLQTELAQTRSLLEQQGLKLAIPPAHLQLRVSGAYNNNFFRLGAVLGRSVESMLAPAGKSFEDFGSILDFGCGCGRVMIPLSVRLKHPRRLFGSDIDPEAIKWCQQNLHWAGGFEVNPHQAPSPFEDAKFDLIYGISVFTHLPEDLQHSWLQDLQRICKSGGFLVLTFHGATHHEKLQGPLREKLNAHGFAYSGAARGTTAGLPDFYQTSFHTTDYVRTVWGEYFEVIDIKADGIGVQDAVLLRKA